MGNSCSSCDSVNPMDAKIQEILEIKRERLKLDTSRLDEDLVSLRSYSIRISPPPIPEILIKSVSKRYITEKYLSVVKIFKRFNPPCSVIFGPLPISPQIKHMEECLTEFSVTPGPSRWLPTIELPDGGYYKGSWDLQTQQQNGFGVLVHPDQSMFLGSFREGRKSGKGRLIRMCGDIYEGDFLNDNFEGIGTLLRSNGTAYTGQFKKGKEHGEGLLKSQGELVYEGEFHKGVKQGRGTLYASEGNVYTGDFVSNMMEGIGTYKWADGKKYTGSWRANKLHGEGIYLWPDKREYKGAYANGNRDGIGIFKWPDGREYRGEWSQGKMHGIGTFTFLDPSGKITSVKAVWVNGKKANVIN